MKTTVFHECVNNGFEDGHVVQSATIHCWSSWTFKCADRVEVLIKIEYNIETMNYG